MGGRGRILVEEVESTPAGTLLPTAGAIITSRSAVRDIVRYCEYLREGLVKGFIPV